ncbi:MAG: OsmC family peroxiredoxin [Gemmatimonadetes bacterium]|nr:OsmC family peroxiredoxin [Gemmatimonadota bacterium]
MTVSTASAVWEGGLRTGKGRFNAGSNAFQGAYTFATRFEGAVGTTPEELMAAAHASCLAMALSADLEKAGTPPTRIATKASCVVEPVGGKQTVSTMRLEVRGKVPGMDQAAFQKAAEGAKANCPVSRALMNNVAFELDALLE